MENDPELEKVLNYISHLSVPRHITKDGAWSNLQAAISSQIVFGGSKPSRKWDILHYAVAAVVLVALCTYFFFHYFTTKTYTTGRGHQISLFLPDGSRVILAPESTISYQSYQWYQNRNVTLKGQAFFEVEKGNPFNVVCNNNQVMVLGTSFNITSRKTQFKAECVTGRIKIKLNNHYEHIIDPGKAIKCAGDSAMIYDFDIKKGTSWTRGEFYFSHESLTQVFQEMERQYDISIHYSQQNPRIYTGYFNATSDLKQALDMVCMPMNLKYRMVDDNTVLVE